MHKMLFGLLLPSVVDPLRPVLKKATSSVLQLILVHNGTDVAAATVQQVSMCHSA